MESGKITKKGWGWLCRLRDWVGPEIVLWKMELWAAASRLETSHLEKAQAETEARFHMEMFTTIPRMTIISASQITTNMLELHNESLEPAEVADRIQELEDELWEKEKCIKRIMEEMNSQLMQFRKETQAKNKIISELKRKLDAQKHDGIEDGMANAATIMNKSLTTTGRVDASQFDFLRILGIGRFGTVILGQQKGGAGDGRFTQ
jgi:predicted RNase H-like nuclease (RuvC/YqgF family)